MKVDELKRKIHLILSQATTAATVYTPKLGSLFAVTRIGEILDRKTVGSIPITVAEPGEADLTNEQVRLLKALYGAIPQRRQSRFVSILLEECDTRTASVVVHTILEIGHVSTLRKRLLRPADKKFNVPVRSFIWGAIRQNILHQSHRFTDDDLDALEQLRITELNRTPDLQYPREDRIHR